MLTSGQIFKVQFSEFWQSLHVCDNDHARQMLTIPLTEKTA